MSDSATPGWYHAEGDPPGTERYWDGSAWTQGPRPVGGVPETPAPETQAPQTPASETPSTGDAFGSPAVSTPPASSPQDGFSAPRAAPGGTPVPSGFPGAPVGVGGFYPEESKATTALIVAIIGTVLCGPPGIAGLVMGNNERKAIAAGRRDPAGSGKATAAMVIGGIALIGTVISVLLIVLILVLGTSGQA